MPAVAPRHAAYPAFAVLALVGAFALPSIDEARPTARRPFALAGPWFRRPEPAQDLAAALRARAGAKKRPAYVVALDDPSLGRIYRVQVGADALASESAERGQRANDAVAPLT